MTGVKNPNPRTTVYLRLPAELRDQLVAHADSHGVPLNRFCEVALTAYLEFLTNEVPTHD